MAATRGLDRGRVTPNAVEQAFADDTAAFVRLQQDAGMDFFSDGLLRWQDIFRPMAETAGTARPEALVRWFDTNTFFREPELSQALRPLTRPNGALPDRSIPRPRVASLPSPFVFSRVARTTRDRNQLMVELATQVLRPVVEASVAAGAKLIHLEDPWLGYNGIDPDDWSPLGDALAAMHRDLKATLVFHVYFGDAGPHVDRLLRLPVDAIGVDLIETDVAELGSGWDKGLVAGLVDGRSSILESLDNTIEVARHLADAVRPRNLYLSSNCELAFLPTSVAERKVQRLGEAARKVRELVSV